MALKPFWIKKSHLGMTAEEVREALQAAKKVDEAVFDGAFVESIGGIRAIIQTDIPDTMTATAVKNDFYENHTILIVQATDIPIIGAVKVWLYKSMNDRYFSIARVGTSIYFADAVLRVFQEQGSDSISVVLHVALRPLAEAS